MIFSNLFFLYAFLPASLILYYLTPSIKLKNHVLLFLSLVFYGLGEPSYIIILLAASYSAFWFAKRKKSKPLLFVSVAVNVSFLFFFKYVPLLVETGNFILGTNFHIPMLALPIGISFYTFQILTYTIDVYTGKTEVQNSFGKFLLYVSLFPQLVAGPIIRYSDIRDQIDGRKTSADQFVRGITCFCCGLAKKVIFADYAGKIADTLLPSSNPSTIGAWMGILMFTFQIYFDFSGYSDMALGLGRMFGFEYVKNFNYPYISTSITEFWRRWHISLGSFFREYVYIPLGGNRKFPVRNIMLVWLLTGFWHGASWNFALWGVYFGVLLIIEKYALRKISLHIPALFKWLFSFFLVTIGWVIFYFLDMKKLAAVLVSMFSFRPAAMQIQTLVSENLIFLSVCLILSMPWANDLCYRTLALVRDKSETAADGLQAAAVSIFVIVVLFTVTAVLTGSSFSPFLYFRF